ncbi:MAG: hypothetical protein K0Q50_1963 [Vampirovibrio sp.]|jgi:hypothetical protein|nr:hypothetical protein [Vampirovibrio sp.]
MIQHKRGQTISEYGLIMGLGLLIGIAGLLNLSGSLQNGFSNMLMNHAHPNSTPDNASQPVTALAKNTQANTEMPVVQNSQTPTAGSSVQVSGANGGKVYANSQKLFAVAAPYQTSNPALYNLLIQLGYSGLTLGGKLSDIETGKTTSIENNFNLDYHDYSSLAAQVKTSEAFKSLSPADQELVVTLTKNTTQTTIDCLNSIGGETIISASAVVQQNSTTIKGCGENGHC